MAVITLRPYLDAEAGRARGAADAGPARRKSNLRARGLFALSVAAAFAGGFAAALHIRPAAPSEAAAPPFADIRVALPEGGTVITITDPAAGPEPLARLAVTRRGKTITGLPSTGRRIAPRARLSPEDLAFFRREIEPVVSPSDSAWVKSNRIREWLTTVSRRRAMPGLATRKPREAYERMRRGEPVLCGNLAEIYAALCEAAGLDARPVGLALLVRDGQFGRDSHAGAEVWVPEMGGWVYQDPTFNCYWEVGGRPAGALALHDAVMERREIKVGADCAGELASGNYVDPRLYFRHLSYEYEPGGALLYYADERVGPINFDDRNWVQTDDRSVIERHDPGPVHVTETRGEVAPGVLVQAIGATLFVRDRRGGATGLRVRSSSGRVEAVAYEHRLAEEVGLFDGRNLARNPLFRHAGDAGSVAGEWSVSGPVDGLTLLGGQGISARSGGRLSQQVRVRPGGHYLMYAKLIVTRGEVRWSIGDAAGGFAPAGEAKPGRVSEVVSDVVPSRSGYLNVSFEVPAGGAFRAVEVIVCEVAPYRPRQPAGDASAGAGGRVAE